MLDYGALPPEINSARMYAGPGSAPMMAAASAWNSLAAELGTTAGSYESVVSELTGEEWVGPASASMATAAAPYVEWMSATAAQAQQAAAQAQVAAAAYETAFAMTVPPPVIAANRAQLAALVATNFLGQNTAAIAAAEAHYGEMWAQDAAAMYSYAANSASASALTPFSSPAQATNPAGIAGQAAVVTQAAGNAAAGAHAQVAQLMATVPGALQGLSAPVAAASGLPSINGILTDLSANLFSNPLVSVALNGITAGAATAVMYITPTLIPAMVGYFAGAGGNAAGGLVGPLGGGSLGALFGPGGPLSTLGALGGAGAGAVAAHAAAAASMGHASLVGALTVPPSWAAANPVSAGAGALHGAGWAAAPESHTLAALPPGISPGGGGRGFGLGMPRYGFKPTVMPRPVIA